MAGADDLTLSETPSWRIAVLVAAIIVITLVWEYFTEKLHHALSHKKRLGLRHVVHKLEEELLALGLISMILFALQDTLGKFCVSKDQDGYEKGGYDKDPYKSDSKTILKVGSDSYPQDDPYADSTGDKGIGKGLRRLLAGGHSCSYSEEPFWSLTAIHQAHIFIFVLACTHIVYAMLSMLICLWKLRKWERWENSMDHRLLEIPDKRLLSRKNALSYYWHAFWASFIESIDRSVYLGLRRLFIERMTLTDSFNFHEFLVNSMEEEFSKVVKLEWVMWVIVAMWILLPSYVVFIMTGLAIVIMMAVGTHLNLIAVKLTHQAFQSYAPKKKLSRGPSLLARISKGVRGKKSNNDDVYEGRKSKMYRQQHRDDLDLHMDSERSKIESREDSHQSFTHQRPKTPHVRKTLADNFYNAKEGDSVAVTIDRTDPGKDDEIEETRGAQGPHLSSSSSSEDEADSRWHRPVRNNPKYLNGKSAMNTHGPNRGSRDNVSGQDKQSVPLRIANWTRGVVSNDRYSQEMRLRRRMTFAQSYAVDDSADLFWFRRPRLMLKAMQYTYFETSLLLAILMFNLWQGTNFIISREYGHPTWLTLGLVFFGLLLMVHSAFFVLPVYALTMAAGSHCPQSILRLAKKKKVKPHMVSALERMSGNLCRHEQHPDSPLSGSVDNEMDWVDGKVDFAVENQTKNESSLSTLLGAMYQETTKNFIKVRDARLAHSETAEATNRDPDRSRLQHTRSLGARTSTEPRVRSPVRRSHSSRVSLGRAAGAEASSSFSNLNKNGDEIQVAGVAQDTSLPLPQTKMPPCEPSLEQHQEHDIQMPGTSSDEGLHYERVTPRDYISPHERMAPREYGAPPGRVSPREYVVPHEQASPREYVTPRGQVTPRDQVQARDERNVVDKVADLGIDDDEDTPKMPSQTILESPSAYSKKCTLYGNHATLREVALLFQKAESFTADQDSMSVPRVGYSGP